MNDTILAILVKHQLTPSIELVEVMREVFLAGVASVLPNDKQDAQDEDGDGPLSPYDAKALRSFGVDPEKKFRLKSRVFTIVGYRPARWKYPISAETQNGARYKFTIEQVKRHQSA